MEDVLETIQDYIEKAEWWTIFFETLRNYLILLNKSGFICNHNVFYSREREANCPHWIYGKKAQNLNSEV